MLGISCELWLVKCICLVGSYATSWLGGPVTKCVSVWRGREITRVLCKLGRPTVWIREMVLL